MTNLYLLIGGKDKSVRGTLTLTTIGIKGIELREEKDGGFHFKILLITYKILNGQSAGYLEPLIKDYHPSRALRSSSRSLLCTPAIKSKTYGGRAFSTAAPQLSKMPTVLLHLKQNSKHFYSGNVSTDSRD